MSIVINISNTNKSIKLSSQHLNFDIFFYIIIIIIKFSFSPFITKILLVYLKKIYISSIY